MEGRQAALDGGEVADARRVESETNDDCGGDQDARQRRRKGGGDARQEPDDRHRSRHQRQHDGERRAGHPRLRAVRARHLKLPELRQHDDDGEAVDETEHDGMRNKPDELAEPEDPRADLNDTHQNDGGEEVFDAVRRHQRNHHDGQRAGGAGDHAGPPAKERGDEPDHEGGIEAHQRMHPGDEGEGHGLRHQRKRDCQTGE